MWNKPNEEPLMKMDELLPIPATPVGIEKGVMSFWAVLLQPYCKGGGVGPNSFNVLTMHHPNASHESKVVVEVAGFPMSDQVELWDCKAEGP